MTLEQRMMINVMRENRNNSNGILVKIITVGKIKVIIIITVTGDNNNSHDGQPAGCHSIVCGEKGLCPSSL